MKIFFQILLFGAFLEVTLQQLQNFTLDERADQCDCGVASRTRRIVGGTEASVGKYPWMAALILKMSTGGYAQFCGGSLTSHTWVVSAAHCFESGITAPSVMISLGDFDLSTTSEVQSVGRTVSQIVIHPKYDGKTHDYDIALLKLSSPVDFTENIRPICMPPPDLKTEGKTATVSGWGATSEDGPKPSKLQEVDVPVLSNTQCQSAYGSGTKITTNMICAGYPEGKKDSCQGDSGGPLFYKCPNGRSAQIGVVSFGVGCARPGLPGVYADLVKLQTFVIEYATGDGLCRTACS